MKNIINEMLWRAIFIAFFCAYIALYFLSYKAYNVARIARRHLYPGEIITKEEPSSPKKVVLLLVERKKVKRGKAPYSVKRIDLYDYIFERLETYFKVTEVYLRPDLEESYVIKELGTYRRFLAETLNYMINQNFKQYVNTWRVKYAKKAFIRNTSLKVEQLALMSGFRSLHSFSMVFFTMEGVRPKEWCMKASCKTAYSVKVLQDVGPDVLGGDSSAGEDE